MMMHPSEHALPISCFMIYRLLLLEVRVDAYMVRSWGYKVSSCSHNFRSSFELPFLSSTTQHSTFQIEFPDDGSPVGRVQLQKMLQRAREKYFKAYKFSSLPPSSTLDVRFLHLWSRFRSLNEMCEKN